MKALISILAAGLFLCIGCTAQPEVDNSVAGDLQLEQYLGDWYEIARFDHRFERGIQFSKANYTLREDGKVQVLNSGIKDGKARQALGKAKLTDNPRILKVSFFGPFYSDYRVMLLDPDYQWVLIGGSSAKYLWILSRTRSFPTRSANPPLRSHPPRLRRQPAHLGGAGIGTFAGSTI